jgi:hypothetical protein
MAWSSVFLLSSFAQIQPARTDSVNINYILLNSLTLPLKRSLNMKSRYSTKVQKMHQASSRVLPLRSWIKLGKIFTHVCVLSQCRGVRIVLTPHFTEDGMSTIPKEQAERLVNYTTAIPHREREYVVQLEVFHQLHCLVSTQRVQPTVCQ